MYAGVSPDGAATARRISVRMPSHSRRASSSPRMPYTMAAAAGAKAKPDDRGAAGLDPSPPELDGEVDRLVELAGDGCRGEQPDDGQVIRLAEEGQLAPLLGVVASGLEVPGGEVHHRRHVQRVGVLPRHLDLVGPGCEQLEATPDGGDGALVLAARQLHGGQRVEGGALQAGVAHPAGQLDGAFDELARQRVALVLRADDVEHGRLDVGITERQRPRLVQQGLLLAGRRQLGHDARCVGDELGCGGELDGGAPPVTGPAGRLGRGAVQPNRLVARRPAPGHGRCRGEGPGPLRRDPRPARPPPRTAAGPRSASPGRR